MCSWTCVAMFDVNWLGIWYDVLWRRRKILCLMFAMSDVCAHGVVRGYRLCKGFCWMFAALSTLLSLATRLLCASYSNEELITCTVFSEIACVLLKLGCELNRYFTFRCLFWCAVEFSCLSLLVRNWYFALDFCWLITNELRLKGYIEHLVSSRFLTNLR